MAVVVLWLAHTAMYICYVDEAGCTGCLPHSTSPIQPIFVVGGVIINQAELTDFTSDFLFLKRRFFPGAKIPGTATPTSPANFLDWVLAEIKGSDIRANVCEPRRKVSRHAIGFLDQFVKFLEDYQVRIVGRLVVKGLGKFINGRSLYSYTTQRMFIAFQDFLHARNETGFMVMDSRWKSLNVSVAHSLFTQKFQNAGDPHPRVVEMPTFGHSENHVGIQVADLLCSALLFPMAAHTFCTGHVNNVHVRPGYQILKTRYGSRLRALQHLYRDHLGKTRGGITLCDDLTCRQPQDLFV